SRKIGRGNGVDGGIKRLDARNRRFKELDRRDFLAADTPAHLDRGQRQKVVVRSHDVPFRRSVGWVEFFTRPNTPVQNVGSRKLDPTYSNCSINPCSSRVRGSMEVTHMCD